MDRRWARPPLTAAQTPLHRGLPPLPPGKQSVILSMNPNALQCWAKPGAQHTCNPHGCQCYRCYSVPAEDPPGAGPRQPPRPRCRKRAGVRGWAPPLLGLRPPLGKMDPPNSVPAALGQAVAPTHTHSVAGPSLRLHRPGGSSRPSRPGPAWRQNGHYSRCSAFERKGPGLRPSPQPLTHTCAFWLGGGPCHLTRRLQGQVARQLPPAGGRLVYTGRQQPLFGC